ncbi:SDR family NAD(P)-dependent oxidoreductase [Halorubrum ezzemoulense]|uniref:SDR family NAD(P)-dependent oxidoreductase n=1 Tax=Halorubrum ezzemoulense TaxID=337243 RepID=UPI00232F6E00|nr:SDR family oxidoreductase [Halorubrum ezzemoulense]MDB2282161.1 SDR family NAD(P)-dependent oxidoreductase [Halorubrum ezzemoulense]
MTRRHDSPREHAVSGRFAGQTAIVTGSTRGIGAGIAERLAAEGANVVVSGRSEDAGEAVVNRIEAVTGGDAADADAPTGDAVFVRADMRDPDDVAALAEAAVEEYGSLDVLVNNAGVQTETAADEATLDDWAFVVETDFRAYWLAARAALDHMDRGAIVNVSSNHAHATMPKHFPYNAVKAGINGMTRSLAVDFGPRVRVNTVVPGWVEIERTRDELPEGRFEEVESIHPTGRIGTPSDVAGAVSFLASEDAAYVTGAALLVDGGRGAVLQDDVLPDYRARASSAEDEE